MQESIVTILEGTGVFLKLFSVAAIVGGLLLSFSSYLIHFRQMKVSHHPIISQQAAGNYTQTRLKLNATNMEFTSNQIIQAPQ